MLAPATTWSSLHDVATEFQALATSEEGQGEQERCWQGSWREKGQGEAGKGESESGAA